MYDLTLGINLIKEYEGLRLKAYRCPSGILTIGYGHTKNVKEHDIISKHQAEALLDLDVKEVDKALNTAISKKGLIFNECQYNALLSFTFNCGIGNLNKLIKDRTVLEIGKAILLYNKSNGVALKGLTKRRQAEHDLYFMNNQQIAQLSLACIQFRVKDNYRIRIAPSLSSEVIAYTDSSKKALYAVKGISMDGQFVLTDKGYLHVDAFYDTFKI